jgi:hypothetical protein
MNIPNRDEFLALPEAEREPVFRYLEGFFVALSVAINALFLAVTRGVLEAGLSGGGLPWWGVWPGLVLVLVVSVGGSIGLLSTLRR